MSYPLRRRAATPEVVKDVFQVVGKLVPSEKLGAHLHLHPMEGMDKKAARKEAA